MIAFPTTLRAPNEYSFDLLQNNFAGPSGETLSGQIISVLGTPFACSMTWNHFDPIQSDIMRAWLAQMHGVEKQTALGDIRRPRPKFISGNPLIDGANQTGTSLALKSMTPGQFFVPGDYIGRANRLHIVTVGGFVDGAGKVTIQIEPPILTPSGDGDLVNLDAPTTTFRLVNNVNKLVSDSRLGRYWSRGITLEFIEDLP